MQKLILLLLFIILIQSAHSQEKIRIVENSRLAKFLSRIKHQDKFAITFGKTIFINCKKEVFFSRDEWVRHELTHVAQYKTRGVFHFLLLYTAYSVVHDYYDNPLEDEAINAEYPEEK